MLVRWQKGAWLRTHIAAKMQPITEAHSATEAAQDVDLEALASTSVLNTQWTNAFTHRKSASRWLPPLECSAVLPLALTLRATVLIERNNDTSPAGTQAVLASSSPDALLNSPHPSALQDCAGKIRSRFLLRFLALLLLTMAGNSKGNASLLCFGTSSVGRREEGGKQTWGSQKLHKQTKISFQCGSEESQRSGEQKEEGGL